MNVRHLTAVAAFALLGTAQAEEVPLQSKSPEELAGKLRPAFLTILTDPDSALFQRVHKFAGHGDKPVICGLVNSKNRSGGYVGYRLFIIDLNENKVYLAPTETDRLAPSETDRVLSQIDSNVIKRKFNAVCN